MKTVTFTAPRLTSFILRFNNFAISKGVSLSESKEHNVQLCLEEFIAQGNG